MSDINCKNCALYAQEQKGCVHQQKEVQETDYCSYWSDRLPICAMCGRPYLGPTYWIEGEPVQNGICSSCAHSLGTCATCKLSDFCAFHQDQSIPLPLTIQRQVRQGNAVMITQVPNPERVKLTCEKCACYHQGTTDNDCYCYREAGQTCSKYQIRELISND